MAIPESMTQARPIKAVATIAVVKQYRDERRWEDPMRAARNVRDGWARQLANDAVAQIDGRQMASASKDFTVDCYRASLQLVEEISQRLAYDKPIDDLPRTARWWRAATSLFDRDRAVAL